MISTKFISVPYILEVKTTPASFSPPMTNLKKFPLSLFSESDLILRDYSETVW